MIVTPETEAGLPPLTLADIDEMERELQNAPDATVERFRRGFDQTISEAELRALLARARAVLQRPDATLDALEAERTLDATLQAALPGEFDFPGRTPEIPIDPANYQFEPKRDALGWIIHAGPRFIPYRLHDIRKADFRWADDYPSKFVYPILGPISDPGRLVEITLFSDFGTGLYHSRYIARHMIGLRPDYAIHLGDVYYAGTASEFQTQFTSVLAPLLATTRLFGLNSNHEMMSGGLYYFDFLDWKHAAGAALAGTRAPAQEQEGSYFCLRGPHHQLIAIDTDYHYEQLGNSRLSEARQRDWLAARLEEGRAAGLTNILLSANEPYEAGKNTFTALYTLDLADLIKSNLIDLWFWGNTHYCALFDRSPATPFIGSCIGHGGFPYDRMKPEQTAGTPTGVRFLETAARFPDWTNVRLDRGNNGFVRMTLRPDGGVSLEYVDWMHATRHVAEVGRVAGGGVGFEED